jgi:hypothetical protein
MAALRPSRYWAFLDRLPVRLSALPSAFATSVAGLVLGGRGFFGYARLAADAASHLTQEAATRQGGGGALGEAFGARLPYGLRTVYPLTKIETTEVVRKAVRYDLPRPERGPGRLT